MLKIQQFYILKIESSRLKESKFKIKNLTIEQARVNGEIVAVSNSQMIRTIQKLKNKQFSQYELDKLLEQKKLLTRKKNKKEHREILDSVNKQIDDMLFIPEIISISFDDRRHFYNILSRKGFEVNGVTYVPFMASAGMIRRDTYLFVDQTLLKSLSDIFNNNRDETVEINPSKFSAYYSLYSSSTLPVSFPKMAVVPDLIIKTIRTVDFSTYVGVGVDPVVTEKEVDLECNAFDGEGLCSPALARKWSRELDMDYVPSVIGVRAPFLKGMLAVFDFHKFAKSVANTDSLVDIYGNEIKVKDVECIVSESMFKLWSSYKSTFEYVMYSKQNDLDWGITKVNSAVEKNFARTSYQFLQVLELSDEQIENLCKPTLDWLSSVSGDNLSSTLLYSLGETNFSDKWFKRLDTITQALILENNLLQDTYVTSHLDKSISKKKNDAKIGRLIFNGNYQVMISDPYAYAAHAFGMGIKPLLNEHQHYSAYWNDRGISQVASIRSPIVHSSEVNVLNFQNDDCVNEWYQHIKSGIIFPANGIGMDSAIQGGSDFDLDLVCTINSPEIIAGRVSGLPVLYDSKKAEKVLINSDTSHLVIDSQVKQIKTNKIGFYTNLSSTFYALLSNFSRHTIEHEALLQRLKYGRVLQGLAIDSTKGILTDPFPEHFSKWKKINTEMTDDEKQYHNFNNSIVGNHRPYFMRWLYSHYNQRYLKELAGYENISQTKWGIPFDKLRVEDDLTTEQKALVDKYKRKSFFIDNDSTMNRITRHIEKKLIEIKTARRQNNKNFDYAILLSSNFNKPLGRDLDKMKLLFKEYKSLKRNFRENRWDFEKHDGYDSMDQIVRHTNQKAYATISSNASELADMAVYLCYTVLGTSSKSFCWSVFGKEIVENIQSKHTQKYVRVPMPSKTGDIEYLWTRYGNFLLNIEEI